MTSQRVVELRRDVLADHDRRAMLLRARFAAAGTFVVNLVASPGAGKTELLVEVLTDLVGRGRSPAALVGDCATDNDATRLAASGAPVRQIVTEGLCHLEVDLVERHLDRWDLVDIDLLFIENVGNLVCPSSFDLGETLRVVLLSVTEGEDKPLKYPQMFRSADLTVITKLDLAGPCEFDRKAALANIEAVHPGMAVIETSARDRASVGAFVDHLEAAVAGGARVAARFEVTGVVQGVGFRPFVHALATGLGLDGHVGNDSTEVFVEVHGHAAVIDEFAVRLVADAPPLSIVEDVQRVAVDPALPAGAGFTIVASREVAGGRTLVPPDTAVCERCLAELFDPCDRRHRHAFITCTDCGPRFTIIRALPYDRPATTMADFPMCAACRAEYDDPASRRHHAQPIACHDCGPRLALTRGVAPGVGLDGVEVVPIEGDASLAATVMAVRAGSIVAVKGLGGYHLMCSATDERCVARLRERKRRPDKPFAVMIRDLAAAHLLAEVSTAEASLLTSAARPVVLLRAHPGSALAASVAPGNPLVGLMLPYTPVQHLLFADGLGPVVMTSGNRGGEPICFDDGDVAERLGPLCDAVLGHDRPIHLPCDDSVVRVVGDRLMPIRRARGYAPLPVRFPSARRRVLAVGGELKNTFVVTSDTHAWVSQHLGDMENLETLQAFEAAVDQFCAFHSLDPEVVAVDAHPGSATARWARARHGAAVTTVQHHHAHVAAVMAEHELDPDTPVLGFAFDGTGYGDDGSIWGGEVLLADANSCRRVAHLTSVPLPGGDAAIRHPCRVALSHLRAAGVDWSDDLAPVSALTPDERALLARVLERGVGCVPTTSMGRLFDAIASLLGLRHHISYEAQAAIELEVAAARCLASPPTYRFAVDGHLFDPSEMIRSMVDDLRAGVETGAIALGFHRAVATTVADLAVRLRARHGVDQVALTGGVFQNALLTTLTVDELARRGVPALTHRVVPPNDGGLSLGQAFVAAHRDAERET